MFTDVIQIAGFRDRAEAEMTARCGVDLLGFPLWLEVNVPDLDEGETAAIIATIRPPAHSVLITYLAAAAEIAALCRRLNVSIVQLHGDVSIDEIRTLREIAPTLRVIKSVVIRRGEAIARLETSVHRMAPCVDAFITDTFDPATGASGATGKTHDWRVSRAIVDASTRPVLLAGGLTPQNVGEAIQIVSPAGVDAHSGVEHADGSKDRAKIEAFVASARQAFERRRHGQG